MRRKNRKFKQNESETNTSSKAESSDVENSDENYEENSDSPEPENKKRKVDRKVSFSPKKTPKEKKDKEEKENTVSKDADNEEPQYEVEFIIDEKMVKGAKHFLIRWKGFDESSDTWEPENILNCPDLIKQFYSNRKNNSNGKNKKGKDTKKLKKKKNNTKNEDDSDDQWDENEEFEIDRIIEVHHKRDGNREFLVSWKGYPHSQNSWVAEEDMTCNDLIAKFMAKVDKAREAEQKELRVKPSRTDRFTLSTNEHGRRLSRRNAGKQRVQYHDAE